MDEAGGKQSCQAKKHLTKGLLDAAVLPGKAFSGSRLSLEFRCNNFFNSINWRRATISNANVILAVDSTSEMKASMLKASYLFGKNDWMDSQDRRMLRIPWSRSIADSVAQAI